MLELKKNYTKHTVQCLETCDIMISYYVSNSFQNEDTTAATSQPHVPSLWELLTLKNGWSVDLYGRIDLADEEVSSIETDGTR